MFGGGGGGEDEDNTSDGTQQQNSGVRASTSAPRPPAPRLSSEEVAAVRAATQQEEAKYPHAAVWLWLHGEAYQQPAVDFCPIDKAPYSWTWMVMPLALCSSLETDVALGAIPIATHPLWGQGRSSRRELRDGRWQEVSHESELSRRFRYWAGADLQTRQQRLRQLFHDMTAECVHRFDVEVFGPKNKP